MNNVFVLEERTHIVSQLRWQFAGLTDWNICGFSSELELFQQAQLQNSYELLVILDFSTGKAVCLQLLQRCLGANVIFPIMLYSSDQLKNLEWALRELGVCHIQCGEFDPQRVARICRWQLESKPHKRNTRL